MSASKHGVTVELDKNVTGRTREEFPAQSGSSRVQGRCIFRCTRKRFYSVAVSAGVCPGQVRSGLRFDDACSDERTGVASTAHDYRDGAGERERQSTVGHGGSAPHCCSIAHVPCQRELEKAFACCSASDPPSRQLQGSKPSYATWRIWLRLTSKLLDACVLSSWHGMTTGIEALR